MRTRVRFADTARGWIFYFVLAVTLVPVSVAIVFTSPFSAKAPFAVARAWARFMLGVARSVCGLDFEELGMENFPADGSPVLVMSKHQSAWECFWMFARLPAKMSFVYKKELHFIPVFGQAVACLKMTAINRSKGASAFDAFMQGGKASLARGSWIVLFPEGTRTAPGQTVRYKTGGARFAEATGVPIVPVALNSGSFWPRNSIGKVPGRITVSVGPVIATQGRSFEAIQDDVVSWIEGEMRRIAPEDYAGSPEAVS